MARRIIERARLGLEALEDRRVMSTCTVTSLTDTGAGSGVKGDLRYCLNVTNANGEPSNRVEFQAGLTGKITLQLGELAIRNHLEIDGPGASAVMISGNHTSGVFSVPFDEGNLQVAIDDLTVTEGSGVVLDGFPMGGGFFNGLGTVKLTRMVITENVITHQFGTGGGLVNIAGSVTLNSCVVSNNSVRKFGTAGGIHNNDGTMTLIDTVVSGNVAPNFAGISNSGTLNVVRSTFFDNVAAESSGAINNLDTLNVIESSFSANGAPDGGSAIYNVYGYVSVRDSTFADNVGSAIHTGGWTDISGSTFTRNVGFNGGALHVYDGTLRLVNSTLSENTATNLGGGIAVVSDDALAEITACTLTKNSALGGPGGLGGGGGISIFSGGAGTARAVIHNTIVSGNSSVGAGPDIRGPVISLGYNFIGKDSGNTGWNAKDRVGTEAAPLDPKLGPLADYGGKTFTHALPADSPAIKQGDIALAGLPDQRGTMRVPFYAPDPGAFQTSEALRFVIEAPEQVDVGQPFDFTVFAVDQWGNRATYTKTVSFLSTDPLAVLPAPYQFVPADLGMHSFSATLNSEGLHAVKVRDLSGFPKGAAVIDVQSDRSDSAYRDPTNALAAPVASDGLGTMPSGRSSARRLVTVS